MFRENFGGRVYLTTTLESVTTFSFRYEYFDFIPLCNFAVLWQVSESQTTEGREGGRPQPTRNAQKRDGGRLPKVLGAVQSSETLSRRERDGPEQGAWTVADLGWKDEII